MKPAFVSLLLILTTGAAGSQNAPLPAQDQHQHDSSWPCIQRRQPHLSLGQVWTGPVPDEAASELARDPQIRALAAGLAQRRLPMDQAETQIEDYAKTADNAHLTALMVAALAEIEPDRAALIAGIGRYSGKQIDLAHMIESRRAKLVQLQSAASPDFDAIDAEEKALDWDQRIFTERRQALTYVCETPVILEQRAFALGRAIASHLN